MRRLVILACLVVGMAGAGDAREMPAEVRRVLDNYTKDSTVRLGLLHVKRGGLIDESIQLKDLRLRAIEVYWVKRDIPIDAYPDTIAFSEIIEPIGFWRVLVMAHNKPLYELVLRVEATGPRFFSASYPARGSSFRCPMWEPLLKAYPEPTEINPIFVTTAPLRLGYFSEGDHFLYFEQKGPRKIYYIQYESDEEEDRLTRILPGSMETLNDSRKLMEHWKKRGINRGRRFNEHERAIRENAADSARF